MANIGMNHASSVGSGLQMSGKSTKKEKTQNIQVVVRCRPLNSGEKKVGAVSVVDVSTEKREIIVRERAIPTAPTKSFTFDRVFGIHSKQIELYKTVVLPILDEVLLGYNCTIFAYGQTGTGKTFTMEGERSEDVNVTWEDDPLAGIIPRVMNQLFSRLQQQGLEFTVKVSFLEIYNEELIDLLGDETVQKPRLTIYEEAKKGGCTIQGLVEAIVKDKAEVYKILQKGTARRQTAATLMNAHSSRSHTLFMVTIQIIEGNVEGEDVMKIGKLNLVDLAGSECIGRSGAQDKRAREAGNINQSLLTLGRVITALVERTPHVPYRESKLTRLLQDSLGGRTKTSIIATISPASNNIDETLSTLDYAFRAKNITNKPEINQRMTQKALLKDYEDKIKRYEKDLAAAREKNGFFVNEENYRAMETQISQQSDKIKEFEELIKNTNEENEKVKKDFEERLETVNADLEETKRNLETTKQNLESTEEKLKKTTKQLEKSQLKNQELNSVVSSLVDSEQRLLAQNDVLQRTVDESVKDVDGLHRKLDRKKEVEGMNDVVQQKFKKDFSELNSIVKKDVESLKARHNNFTTIFESSLDGAFKNVSTDMQSIVDLVTKEMKVLVKEDEERALKLYEIINNSKEENFKMTEEEVNRFKNFKIETLATFAANIKAALEEAVKGVEQHKGDLINQVNSMKTSQEKFTYKLLEKMNEHKLKTSDFCEQLKKFVEQKNLESAQHKQLMNKKIYDFVDQLKMSAATLIKDVSEVDEEDNKKSMELFNKMKVSNCDYLQQSNDFHATASNCLTSNNESFAASLDADAKENDLHLSQLSVKMSQGKLLISDFMADADSFDVRSTEKLLKHGDCNRESLNKIKICVGEGVEYHNEKSWSIVAEMQCQQATRLEKLQEQFEQEHKRVADHTCDVSSRTEDVSRKLSVEKENVDTFIEKEIKKDVPTGTTPQRKNYQYPKNIDRPKKLSDLRAEFRANYYSDEASNIPLPDDVDEDEETLPGKEQLLKGFDQVSISSAPDVLSGSCEVLVENKENVRPVIMPAHRVPPNVKNPRIRSASITRTTSRLRAPNAK